MAENLQRALIDSGYLLQFCSRVRIDMKEAERAEFDGHIDHIVAAQQAYDVWRAQPSQPPLAFILPTVVATAFWKSYIKLSNIAAPATIESLRYFFDVIEGPPPPRSIVRIIFTWFAVIVSFGLFIPGQRSRTRAPFFAATIVALAFCLTASLVSYVGTTTLAEFDSDYRHWTAMSVAARPGSSLRETRDNSGKLLTLTVLDARKTEVLSVEPHRLDRFEHAFDHLLPALTPSPPSAATVSTRANADLIPPSIVVPAAAAANCPPITALEKQCCTAGAAPLATPAPTRLARPASGGSGCRTSRRAATFINVDTTKPAAPANRAAPPPVPAPGPTSTAQVGAKAPPPIDDRLISLPCPPSLRDPANPVRLWNDCHGAWFETSARSSIIADELVHVLAELQAERDILWTVVVPMNALLHPRHTLSAIRHLKRDTLDDAPKTAPERALLNDSRFMRMLLSEMVDVGVPIPINLPPPASELIAIRQEAVLFLAALQNYVLPVLFGLLGACVQVVRTTSRNVETFTFMRSSRSRYWARLVLGMVAGPAITWLIDPHGSLLGFTTTGVAEQPTITSHLPPIALAFVAGYAIEILFSILDRFITVFRDPSPASTAARERSAAVIG